MKLILIYILLLCGVCFSQNSYKAVQISSFDSFVLHGKYYDPQSNGPAILLIHQCNRKGEYTGFESLASRLVDQGFHVLLYDSRGFGKSTNKTYTNYHAQMNAIDKIISKDVESAYQFMISLPKVDRQRIGVVGASCGTWQAIPLAKQHPEIRTLVFLSGSYLELEQIEKDYEFLLDRPILAIYSEDDRYGTPESMREAFKRSKHKASQLMVYKGNAHGTALFEHHKELESFIVGWFKSILAGRK